MRPRPVVCRLWQPLRLRASGPRCQQSFTPRPSAQTQSANVSTRYRPTVSSTTSSNSTLVRTYASERTRHWLRHEFKLFIRYGLISLAGFACFQVVYFMYQEEKLEREYPTPHEWEWRERHMLREAKKWTKPHGNKYASPSQTLQLARNLCLAHEDLNRNGHKIPRLHDHEDPNDETPWEFIPHDISGMSEEWRRGYFETIMLAAKAAGDCDGWLKDKGHSGKVMCWEPKFVIGPSNPRPAPVPPGSPPPPREEDCEVAFPAADRFYLKILATQGLNQRQRMQAALEYANFLELKRSGEGAGALYDLALAEATQGLDKASLPYDPKTLVMKEKGPLPSLNILEAVTAVANHKARGGDTASALPMYISLLKVRRALPTKAPRVPVQKRPKPSTMQQIVDFVSEPDYPAPPTDGTQPPWRSPEELCQEGSLDLYIGEILYASSSQEDGVAWTREGVDLAEEQMRELKLTDGRDAAMAKDRCRECLKTGLDNWSLMVTRLMREEQQKKKEASKPSALSFWNSAPQETEGRWEAEATVVKERIKRTLDLVDDTRPMMGVGAKSLFQA
ncbi:uncharacterized protein F5Z01DRAFT_414889 [Emericellopsis atlantica]|uniref:MFS maltose permease n=1 Tax=Emericellopsis atlantica TaxID=2614577 RepID=A0A9P7ZSX5_9HYPO|nr:uncharacterized protein F5Z01DRAFT_414889 [Emericellopsis atlantica]KAG9257764.1 hypothetical protein F5Z01DRAFT_414889 [Emericellopsis atlantica]